jgi:hypothetical protein
MSERDPDGALLAAVNATRKERGLDEIDAEVLSQAFDIIDKLAAAFENKRVPPQYLILCKQRSAEGCALWWRPNRSGYTVDVYQAGRYSKEEADSIADIRGEDYPVPEDAVGDVLELRTVVCVEDGDNFATLKAFTGNTEANGK